MARIGASEIRNRLKDNELNDWYADNASDKATTRQQTSTPQTQIMQRQNRLHIDPKNGNDDSYGTAGGGSGRGTTKNPYEAQANALYEQLMSRGDFNYDLQGDMLYRQYADQYSQLGKTAMRDAMGTAAGLTGGYGNSYAQQVGNQQYQQYLGQLNAMIPEFYDRAYNVWLNEGEDLQNRYQLALQMAGAYGGGGGGTTGGIQTVGGAPENAFADYVATHAPADWAEAFNAQAGMIVTGPTINTTAGKLKAAQDIMELWRRQQGQ